MLGIGYIALALIMTSLLLIGHYKAAVKFYQTSEIAIKKTRNVFLFVLCAFIYLFLLSYFEVLFDFGMPPRFPIFLVIPFFTFCIYFVIKNKKSAFIKSIPLHWTAFFQSFRIFAELLLLGTFLKGVIPVKATFEGHNFDIAIGITALIIGFLILKTGRKHKAILQIWNVVGIILILIVAVTIATSIYFPEIWGYSEPAVHTDFLLLPYLFIPGYLAPMAIFIHLVSLIQLSSRK